MLNITTDSGVRLDLNPKATIEVNMGGISLLDLSSRTATYTNSFSLPRTPTNEAVFEFASQPTRNNRPSIDVVISKGLFQRAAVLKVLEFDKEYKCSLSYDKLIDSLKLTTLDFISAQTNIYQEVTSDDMIQSICNLSNDAQRFKVMRTNTDYVSCEDSYSGNLFIKLYKLFELFEQEFGIAINGTLLSDADFLDSFLLYPEMIYKINQIVDPIPYRLDEVKISDNITLCSEVLQQIALLFMADVSFKNDEIVINKIDTASVGISIDGFKNFKKSMVTSYAKNNYIKYKNEGNDEFFGSDVFSSIGLGEKDVVSLNVVVPNTDTVGYITNQYEKLRGKVIIMTKKDIVNKLINLDSYSATVDIYNAGVLTLSGFYSNILNPIFANPVILEADRYIDPLTADNIMTTRVINSVQLGGRYWVDQFSYNLTTGNSKLTLIKLP